MEILSSEVGDVGATVRYLHCLNHENDVTVSDLHGLVLLELVQDSLCHFLGCPVLGAQRPVVKRHRFSHLLVAAVTPEAPYRRHGPAALHAALGNLEDGLNYADGLWVPDDYLGDMLLEPGLVVLEHVYSPVPPLARRLRVGKYPIVHHGVQEVYDGGPADCSTTKLLGHLHPDISALNHFYMSV